MQERCIRRTYQYGRLWMPGDGRTIDRVDENGVPQVSAHFRALEDGEVVGDGDMFDPEEAAVRKKEVGMRDKTAAIQHALSQLDPDVRQHWTASGLPSRAQVHLLTDLEVTRAEIQAVDPEFDREFARKGRKIEADTKKRSAS